MSLGRLHVKLPVSPVMNGSDKYCHNKGVELENKVLSKWEIFVKEI